MIGVPMPPTPDEPRHTQRVDEHRPWNEHGLYLGESDAETEHMAALRAAVEIERIRQQRGEA